MMDDIILKRLARLESIKEIESLAFLYCRAMDEHGVAILRRIFAPEGCVTFANGQMPKSTGSGAGATDGVDGVVAMYKDFWTQLGPTYHWMHGHQIDFDAADENKATGLVTGHAETYRNGEVHITALRYNDRYRRHDGYWMFAERRISFLYFCKASEYGQILNRKNRVTVYGDERPADWPECYESWTNYLEKS